MTTTNCTNTYIVPTSNREVTKPLQPAFMALYSGAGIANITGDGTVYTCTFPTEIFDQNADFADPTFTAPVTGRYLFDGTVQITNVAAGHTVYSIQIATSNRTYAYNASYSAAALRNGGGACGIPFADLCDMDSGDIANILVTVSGGTKTIWLSLAYFSGSLVV